MLEGNQENVLMKQTKVIANMVGIIIFGVPKP
jgi:hypothetical protein